MEDVKKLIELIKMFNKVGVSLDDIEGIFESFIGEDQNITISDLVDILEEEMSNWEY